MKLHFWCFLVQDGSHRGAWKKYTWDQKSLHTRGWTYACIFKEDCWRAQRGHKIRLCSVSLFATTWAKLEMLFEGKSCKIVWIVSWFRFEKSNSLYYMLLCFMLLCFMLAYTIFQYVNAALWMPHCNFAIRYLIHIVFSWFSCSQLLMSWLFHKVC